MIWFFIACATTPEPPPPVEGPQVETLLGPAKGVSFVGDWTSGPCPGRTYARNIRFDGESNWAMMDMVSPCPAGTTCMWSGLTTSQGIWEFRGETLETRVIGGNTEPGPTPTSFRATETGELVERGCSYARGFTVPPGYTEAQVTPQIVR